jgi:hypothetical protein
MALINPLTSAGFGPMNLGYNGVHITIMHILFFEPAIKNIKFCSAIC